MRKAEGIALLAAYGGDDDAASPPSADEDEQENEEDELFEEVLVPSEKTENVTPERDGSSPLTVGQRPEESETVDVQDERIEDVEGAQVSESDASGPHNLNCFLPPPPSTKYSGELQSKFAKYLALKKSGKSLNEVLRNSKDYRNPDFLQSAVRLFDIDHIGSCFKKEVFDPHGYEPSDYHDSIALEVRREAERKEQERRQTQRVDFVRSTIQTTVTVEKTIVPIAQKAITMSSSETSAKTDGRSSKKSKWDKVELDGSRSSQSITIAADAIAAANAHAALLTANSNAGAGYASFAQQRRREAEEKSRAEKHSSSGSNKLERKTERSQ